MSGFWLLLTIVELVCLGALVEMLLHRRNLRRIRLRIHVNGTRGKSSVTRLIAAGLREGGLTTCAKTTGTLARMILPDGSEYPVFRPSEPNIIEQVRIVAAAAKAKADVLVVECMALTPVLQFLSEQKLVRATHAVITNARADHLDVMGPEEDDVALALAGMVPAKGRLYTREQRHLAVFRAAAQDRAAELVAVGDEEVATVGSDELSRFPYVEHAENVALALRVCADLGIDRATALRGMWKARSDPGAMTIHHLDFFGRKMIFVNGFAANDPESTQRIWNMALERFPEVGKRIALFNCRADRPDRSLQLGAACARWRPADHYVLIGSGAHLLARAATRAGMDARLFAFAEHRGAGEIFEAIASLAGPSCLVMGMGNIGGPGLEVVQYFRNRSMPEAA